MKIVQKTSLSLAIGLVVIASAARADSRDGPSLQQGGEDYSDSYQYSDGRGEAMPQPGYGQHWQGDGRDMRMEADDAHRHRWFGHRGAAPQLGYDYGVVDDTVMYQGHWVGSMTGSWNGGPVRTWQGSFDSTNGQTHWHGSYVAGPTSFAPPPQQPPMGPMHGMAPPQGYGSYHGGYDDGYRGQGYEEVLIPSHPIITRTVTTHVSYVDVPLTRTRYVYERVWRAAPKPVHHYHRPAPKCIIGS